MGLKDWLTLITSWISIVVTIWLGVRKDDKPKRKKRRKK